MHDSITAVGYVRVVKHDLDGNLIFDRWFKNQITNFARTQAANAWASLPVKFPSQIAVGTGSPTSGGNTSPDDTALWSEVSGSRKAMDYAELWLDYYTQYSVTYQSTEVLDPNNTTNNESINILEAGLFDADGNLWSHVILNGVTHDNQSTLAIQWQVYQQGN